MTFWFRGRAEQEGRVCLVSCLRCAGQGAPSGGREQGKIEGKGESDECALVKGGAMQKMMSKECCGLETRASEHNIGTPQPMMSAIDASPAASWVSTCLFD